MPTTRKKVVKTVYKDEESEGEAGDFSDSGSEAKISEASSSEDEEDGEIEDDKSSGDDFRNKAKKGQKEVNKPPIKRRKPKFAKDLINKINKQITAEGDEDIDSLTSKFTIKDLTDADKLLPSFLNLSESDSSDDDSLLESTKKKATTLVSIQERDSDGDNDKIVYRDVWSNNIKDNSEDIARKTFMELEKHKSEIEQTKASIESYVSKNQASVQNVSNPHIDNLNVNDLLAQGEDVVEKNVPAKNRVKSRKLKVDSDSEVEDWEEVNEVKSIPQQGLQLFVEFPNTCKKSKKLDLEMMMKRKLNRVKKEYQVYMHKVHVLCWLGHGNYVSQVLNDQEVMAAAIAMVPKGCYPEERLTTKYVEQITTWYKDKLTLKQDKYEHKFRPKAPPLKNTILSHIKSRVTTAKKYNVFIFVTMLRALGLQCRVMFNFVTVPIKPPSSELCSLSTKPKSDSNKAADKSTENAAEKCVEKDKSKTKAKTKAKCTKKIAQVDGIYDTFSESDSECENILQLDGSNDTQARSIRSTRAKKIEPNTGKDENDGVSPPKKAKANTNTAHFSEKRKTGKDVPNTSEDQPQVALKSDKPPEAPKSPLRKRSIRNKTANATKTENSKSLNKDDKSTMVIADEKKDKSQENLNTLPKKRTARTKSTSKTENTNTDNSKPLEKNTKATIDFTDNSKDKTQETQALPSKRTAKNKDDTSKKSTASPKRETSKSPQTRSNNALENNTSKNKKALETSHRHGTAKDSLLSSKTLSPSLKVTSDDTAKSKDVEITSPRKTRSERRTLAKTNNKEPTQKAITKTVKNITPAITVTDENDKNVESKFFSENKEPAKRTNLSRKRSHTSVNIVHKTDNESNLKLKTRTKSAPGSVEKSKYFNSEESMAKKPKLNTQNNRQTKKEQIQENKLRVSHRDLRQKVKPKNDVTEDLVDIIKSRIKVEKAESKKGIVKGKLKEDSDDDSDFLPVEDAKSPNSDDDFKPTKISPRPSKVIPKAGTSKRLDRQVLSSDDDVVKHNKMDVWCEVFVEELEQWIAVDVIKGKVHCTSDIYTNATHPVCYIVGWDNNNYLKDLTRRYVPHWNTVTRKQRAEPGWWKTALQPWLGPKTARDREEDEYLDRMQLEAPLPKSIAEYKNHPLYALKRHLLKFEALYPPDAVTLGFVRGEAVYPRDCVYTCQSRDKWLKEAKVVRLGEQPYKIVKARPKWDRLSNKCITDKPLEVFGPWQVQDYEPPTAENGIVPRNAYGNVELFKDCMLPKKTVHIKLPGLNKVAKKLNIDCAPAMTGFDFNGGFSHPVYDGFVVCEEFEEIVTEAWIKDQEDQERKEREKTELRVYGNWKRLIRGLMIRERLKLKYGFEKPTAPVKPKSKGPRFVVNKK